MEEWKWKQVKLNGEKSPRRPSPVACRLQSKESSRVPTRGRNRLQIIASGPFPNWRQGESGRYPTTHGIFTLAPP